MKLQSTWFRFTALLLWLWPLLPVVGAEDADSDGRPEFQSFRIIMERNIFDPNRSTRRERTRAEPEAEKRVRTESIGLLGTMNYDKGWLAFFDGSDSDYRKALRTGDTIAGLKITEIAPNYVKLDAGNNQPIDLRVGDAISRRDEGAWEISERTEPTAATTAATRSSGETNSSDGESDIVKRLMQQREQELQK